LKIEAFDSLIHRKNGDPSKTEHYACLTIKRNKLYDKSSAALRRDFRYCPHGSATWGIPFPACLVLKEVEAEEPAHAVAMNEQMLLTLS
jgi:hypothetical protein